MLERVKKTPGKTDDFLVLALGVLTFVPFVLRVLGIVKVSFVYFDVGVPLVVFGFVMFQWGRALIGRLRRLNVDRPSPWVTLLGFMAVYHFLMIYRVTTIGENALPANLWLLGVSYAVSAVLLGRYLWVADFFAFVAWMISALIGLATAGRKAGDEARVVFESEPVVFTKTNPDPGIQIIQRREMRPLKEIDLGPYDEHPQETAVSPAQVTRPNFLPDQSGNQALVNQAANGDLDAIRTIIEKVSLKDMEALRVIFTTAGVRPDIFEKYIQTPIETNNPDALKGAFRFENQRQAFMKALE